MFQMQNAHKNICINAGEFPQMKHWAHSLGWRLMQMQQKEAAGKIIEGLDCWRAPSFKEETRVLEAFSLWRKIASEGGHGRDF